MNWQRIAVVQGILGARSDDLNAVSTQMKRSGQEQTTERFLSEAENKFHDLAAKTFHIQSNMAKKEMQYFFNKLINGYILGVITTEIE